MRSQHMKRRTSDAVSSVLLERRAREASARNGGSLWYVPDEALGANPNLCPTPEAVGAVAGTPGTLPTGWGWGGAFGFTVSVGGISTQTDGTQLLSVSGTGTVTSNYSDFISHTTLIPVSPGTLYTVSAVCKLVSGTIPSLHPLIVFDTAGQTYISQASMIYDSASGRWVGSATAPSNAATIRIAFLTDGMTSGNAYTFSAQVGAVKVEKGSVATPYIPLSKLGGPTTSTEPQINAAFVDSAGTQPLSAIGQAVGLLTDRSPARQDAVLTITNLLQYSNDLTQWAARNNGTATATKFTPDTTSNIHRVQANSVTISSGVPYTAAVRASASGYRYLYINGAASPNVGQATFDLQTGTVVAIANGTATIAPVGDGSYICAVSAISNSTLQTLYLQVNNSAVATDTTFAGDGTSAINFLGQGTFVGTLTAAQIAACGIPLTTNAASSTSSYAVGPAANNLGPELSANYTGWTTGTGWSVSNGLLIASGAAANTYASKALLTAGSTYRVTVRCNTLSAGGFKVLFEGGASLFGDITQAGTYSAVLTAASTGSVYLWSNSTLSGVFDFVSVRQVFNVSPNAAQNLGPELVAYPGGPFTATTGWNSAGSGGNAAIALSGSELQLTSTSAAASNRIEYPFSGLTVGRTYKVTVQTRLGTAASGVGHTIGDASVGYAQTSNDISIVGTSSAPYTFTFVANSPTGYLQFATQVTGTLFVASASIKPVLGTTASQSTAANRPVLTQVPRKLGANLVANPGPFTNTSNWTAFQSTVSIVGSEMQVQATGAVYGCNDQSIPVIPGRRYRVTFRARLGTATQAWLLGGSSTGARQDYFVGFFASTTTGTYTADLVATTSTLWLRMQTDNTVANGTILFSFVSVQEVLSQAPALSFDGVNDTLATNSAVISGAATFVWAGTLSSLSASFQSVIGAVGASRSANVIVLPDGTVQLSNMVDQALVSAAGFVKAGTPVVISAILRVGGISEIRVNGAVAVSGAVHTVPIVSNSGVQLMSYAGSQQIATGTLSLANAYNSAIPLADLKAIEAYAADRCGATLVA